MSDGPDRASPLPDDLAKRIYAETRAFYSHLEPRLGSAALGFKILYGPPLYRTAAVFIGYQPGGGTPDMERERASGAHEGWPATCEYATAAWPLAAALRNIFGPEYLSRCVGLNAIFLRAPRVDVYEATIPPGLRSEIDAFCLPRARAIITALEPQRVIVIGFGTARLFGSAEPVLWGKRGSVLAKRVQIAGIDALAIPHLTGSRLSASDRVAIAGTLLGGPPPEGRRVLTSGPAASGRSAARLSGPYTVVNAAFLREKASRTGDPRTIFYEAMLSATSYEAYLAKVGDICVEVESYRTGPISGRMEIAYARRRGWIADC
jgi:hypothetical protein